MSTPPMLHTGAWSTLPSPVTLLPAGNRTHDHLIYTICFVHNIQVMPHRSHTGPSSSSGPNPQSVRLIVTCLTIAGAFTLCWMPIQMALVLVYAIKLPQPIYLLRWLALFNSFNSCINPFIYGVMWRPFRAALRDVSSRARQSLSLTFLLRIIIGSDRRPETKQGIEGKIDRFRSGRLRVRVRYGWVGQSNFAS